MDALRKDNLAYDLFSAVMQTPVLNKLPGASCGECAHSRVQDVDLQLISIKFLIQRSALQQKNYELWINYIRRAESVKRIYNEDEKNLYLPRFFAPWIGPSR
jgi:hypothetical protein